VLPLLLTIGVMLLLLLLVSSFHAVTDAALLQVVLA
jgi:hypothetical protein